MNIEPHNGVSYFHMGEQERRFFMPQSISRIEHKWFEFGKDKDCNDIPE